MLLGPVTNKKDPANYAKYLVVEGFGIFSAEYVSQPCVTCLSVFALISALSKRVYKYMLFAGWEVRMVKNCDRGLENTARGNSRKRYRGPWAEIGKY